MSDRGSIRAGSVAATASTPCFVIAGFAARRDCGSARPIRLPVGREPSHTCRIGDACHPSGGFRTRESDPGAAWQRLVNGKSNDPATDV
ncbi:MAG: hypothetical protein OXC84_08680 [Gammaproteobacteria bacterium]|nr:hypothetical protein [Gammaproteobacteria bacterium]